MTHIDDLPVYVWPDIFRNLSIKDILNCRLVNKKFKDFSDFNNCIDKLVVVYKSDLKSNKHWYFTNKLIDKDDVIKFDYYQKIKSLPLFNLNINLRYLRFDHLIYNFNFEQLSSFTNLVYLEINYEIYWNQYINLNLSNLKMLVFNTSNDLRLNAPKLEKIKWKSGTKRIYFQSSPNSIKHFILDYFTNNLRDITRMYENLEIIELNRFPNADQLNYFYKLKQLKIHCDLINDLKNSFHYLKSILTTRDLHIDIYLKGVKLLNIQSIYQIHFIKYQLNNYDLLDLNNSSIDYNYLKNFLENDLPKNFFNKYSNLSVVNVSKDVKNIDSLIWFIRKLKASFIELRTNNISLNQNFYDNLPITIFKLRIEKNSINLNYNFLFKLNKLSWFETDKDDDLFQFTLNLFSNSLFLEHFAFNFKRKKIQIERKEQEYTIYIKHLLRGDKIDLENLNNLDYYNLAKLCDEVKNSILK